MLNGMSQRAAEQIVRCRADGPFRSFQDFVRRTRLSSSVLAALAHADAFHSLGLSRREALWAALVPREPPGLFDGLDDDEPPPTLPQLSPQDHVVADYQTAGLSLRAHPLSFYRQLLRQQRVVPAAELATLPPDRRYKVGGLVLLRQHPSTAKGITFMTIEDETGTANLIVKQDVWERYHRVSRGAAALIAYGPLQRKDGVIHILVERLQDLTKLVATLNNKSRDFR